MNRPRTIEMEVIPLWSILLDATIIATSHFSTTITEKYVKPFQAGFFCNDDTIRYPYKSSTVPTITAYSISVIIPVTTMFAVELWIQHHQKMKFNVLVAGWMVPEWIVRLVREILHFGYGLGFLEIMVNVAKSTVGSLRPHFMDVCKPNVLCNDTEPHTYITDYKCTGSNEIAIYQSRLSFPSGHATLVFYAAVFTVIYLEKRIRWPERAIVVKTAFEIFVLMLAWYTALTRISDAKHHWRDMAAGTLTGTACAFFWVRCVLRLPLERGPPPAAAALAAAPAADASLLAASTL